MLIDDPCRERLPSFGRVKVTLGSAYDAALHEQVHLPGKRFGIAKAGLLGTAAQERSDSVEVLHTCFPDAPVGSDLEQHLDERAGLVVAPILEPLVEFIEDRQKLIRRIVGSFLWPSVDHVVCPQPLPFVEEPDHKIVFRREVPVKRRLGDGGLLHHLIDPDRVDATPGEQVIGGRDYAVFRGGRVRHTLIFFLV